MTAISYIEKTKYPATDKGAHGFLEFYNRVFGEKRRDVKKVLEFGVHKGDSLRMWRDLFPSAQIYGADINPDTLFTEDRIVTGIYHQGDKKAVQQMLVNWGGGFDVVVDDGSHYMDDQMRSLAWLFPFINPGGVFVVEDAHTAAHPAWGVRPDNSNSSWRSLTEWQLKGVLQNEYLTDDEIRYLQENTKSIQTVSHHPGFFAFGKASSHVFVEKKDDALAMLVDGRVAETADIVEVDEGTTVAEDMKQDLTLVCRRANRVSYDLEVVTNTTAKPVYFQRLQRFLKLGMLSTKNLSIHISMLLNPEDSEKAQAILDLVRPDIDVDVYVSRLYKHIFRQNAYMLQQFTPRRVNARWYIRQDDDSCSDCDALVSRLDVEFPDTKGPSYLISNPLQPDNPGHAGEEVRICRDMGFVPCAHEYEAGIFSAQTLQKIETCPAAIEFLKNTLYVDGAGDRTWVLAANIAGVPPTEIHFISSQPRYDHLAAWGGYLCHVHYVNWTDATMVKALETHQFGHSRPTTATDILSLVGTPVLFGRGAGHVLYTITLSPSGDITGAKHENEAFWTKEAEGLVLRRRDKQVTTVLNTTRVHPDGTIFLTGDFFDGPHITHFITSK